MKPKWSSANSWINKLLHVHIEDYYTTTNRNEPLIHVTTYIDLKIILSRGKKGHTLKTKPVRPSGTLNAILLIYCGLGSCTNHHHIPGTQQLGLHIEPYLWDTPVVPRHLNLVSSFIWSSFPLYPGLAPKSSWIPSSSQWISILYLR